MPISVETFFRQSACSSERLIEVCAQLTDDQLDAPGDGSYGSIRETLLHLLSTEQYYLGHLGRPLPAERVTEHQSESFEALTRAAHENGARLASAAAECTPELVIPGTETDSFTDADATVFLVQAINHSSEHRTQIMTMLTALGAGPADLDSQIDGWSWAEATGALRPKSASS